MSATNSLSHFRLIVLYCLHIFSFLYLINFHDSIQCSFFTEMMLNSFCFTFTRVDTWKHLSCLRLSQALLIIETCFSNLLFCPLFMCLWMLKIHVSFPSFQVTSLKILWEICNWYINFLIIGNMIYRIDFLSNAFDVLFRSSLMKVEEWKLKQILRHKGKINSIINLLPKFFISIFILLFFNIHKHTNYYCSWN